MIGRILNPELRKENAQFFGNVELIQPVLKLFEKFPESKKNLEDEFRLYRNKPLLLATEAVNMPPHQWWAEAAYQYFPTLSIVAARITQASGSASMTERNWSFLDYQLDKRRLRLSNDSIDALLSVQFNFPALSKDENVMTYQKLTQCFDQPKGEASKLNQAWCNTRAEIDQVLMDNDAIQVLGDEIEDFDLSHVEEDIVNCDIIEEVELMLVRDLVDWISIEGEEVVTIEDEINEDADEQLYFACVSPQAGQKGYVGRTKPEMLSLLVDEVVSCSVHYYFECSLTLYHNP
ncbi:hypothetical protein GEMRC1_004367 [Eukaryota sp. GEM-RC1]